MAEYAQLLSGVKAMAESALTRSITDPRYRVFSLVRIANVVLCQKSILKKHLYDFALISHFDFTITCDLKPVCIIECDGDWLEQPHQWNRDGKKDEICRSLGLPLIRVDVGDMSYGQIESTFSGLLQSRSGLDAGLAGNAVQIRNPLAA